MRNFTDQHKDFIRRYVGRARVKDIAAAIGKSHVRVLHYAADMKLPGVRRSGLPIISAEAVAMAWRAEVEGGSTPLALDLLFSPERKHKRVWTAAEDAELLDCAAQEHLSALGKRMGRTLHACRERLKGLGQGALAYKYQLSRFPAALKEHNGYQIDQNTVYSWHYRGLIRTFKQAGNARCMNADDWDWLLENWRFRETDWAALRAEVWAEETDELSDTASARYHRQYRARKKAQRSAA